MHARPAVYGSTGIKKITFKPLVCDSASIDQWHPQPTHYRLRPPLESHPQEIWYVRRHRQLQHLYLVPELNLQIPGTGAADEIKDRGTYDVNAYSESELQCHRGSRLWHNEGIIAIRLLAAHEEPMPTSSSQFHLRNVRALGMSKQNDTGTELAGTAPLRPWP